VPTLLELEAKAQKAWQTAQTAGWEWAVAITEIHDSRCYPGSAEAGSWETYMLSRWGIRRAQAFNVVAWVHHEMTLTLVPMLPEELETDGQSTSVDSGTGKQAIPPTTGVSVAGGLPPAKPVHATERESREARTKHRKIRGKLNEDDLDALREAGNVVQIEGGDDYISRTEADRQAQEGDLVKVDDKYYRPGDLTKPAAAKEKAQQTIESEPPGIGPIEKDIRPEKPKEDSERAKILKWIAKLLSDWRHGWSTNEYYQLLMDLAEMIDREIEAVEGSNA
jgi:hypothetical protein